MLDKIDEILHLQRKLDEDHGIISVRGDVGCHVHGLDNFLKICKGDRIFYEKRDGDEYPHELMVEIDGINFYVILEDCEMNEIGGIQNE